MTREEWYEQNFAYVEVWHAWPDVWGDSELLPCCGRQLGDVRGSRIDAVTSEESRVNCGGAK